jgi:hypothetical protein
MKPIPVARFKKYLKSKGLVHIRTEGGHECWDTPEDSLCRPVTIQTHFKEIPLLHIKTNLRTMNISNKEFEKEIGNF